MKVIIDLTEKCNLRCKHCGNSSDSPIEEELDFITVLENIPYTVTSVDLLGGEPLLYGRLDALLDYMAENTIKVSVISNGQFGDDFAELLASKSIRNLSISIDGLQEENDKVRGKGSFNKAMAFLDSLLKYRIKGKMEVGVNIVINRLNGNSICALINKVLLQGVDYISINRILESGRARGSELLLNDEQYLDEVEKICSEFYKSAAMEKITFDLETPFLAYYLNMKYNMHNELRINDCDAAQHSIYIDARGNIFPCRGCRDNIPVENFKDDLRLKAEKLLKAAENVEIDAYCDDCFLIEYCFRCPLDAVKNPEICKVLQKRFLEFLDGFRKYKVKIPTDIFVVSTENKTYLTNPSLEKNYTIENRELLSYFNTSNTLEEISVQSNTDYYVLADFVMDLVHRGGCKVYEFEESYL